MTELPFLVIHGALVWKVLLVVLVAATVGNWWRRVGRQLLVTIALIATTLWAFALFLVGHVLAPERPGQAVDHVAPFGRAAIAAALPGSRHDALWAITSSNLTHDEAGLQLGLAIDRFEGRCESQRLADANRLEEALEAARRCGKPEEVVVRLLALGRFDEAAATVDASATPWTATLAFVAVGRWRDAANASGKLATEKSVTLRCFGLALSSWAGDPEALGQLDAQSSRECQVLSAVVQARPIEIEVGDPAASFAWKLGLAAGFDMYERHWPEARPWLGVPQSSDAIPLQADSLRQRDAIRAMELGRFERAASALSATTSEGDRAARALAVDLAIRSGLALPPQRIDHHDANLDLAELLRRGTVPDDAMAFKIAMPDACPLRAAVIAAVDGDGGPLAEVLRTCRISSPALWWWLPAVFARVTEHRAELAAVVRVQPSEAWGMRESPFDQIWSYSLHRDASRLIGDREEADRWQQIIERHGAVLSDRRRALAIAIWSAL